MEERNLPTGAVGGILTSREYKLSVLQKFEANHVPSYVVPPGRTLRRPVEEPVLLFLGMGLDQVPDPRGDRMADHHGGTARDRARAYVYERRDRFPPVAGHRVRRRAGPAGQGDRGGDPARRQGGRVLRAGGPGRNLPAGRHRVGPFLLYLRGHQQPRLRPHAQGRDSGGMAAERPGADLRRGRPRG